MKKYFILSEFCGGAIYLLINAVYALRSPTKFLSARWTVRRGLSIQTPNSQVRALGAFFALLGAFLAWESIRIMNAKFN